MGAGLVKTVSRIVWPYTRAALCDLLQRHPADVFVSFHPIPNYALSMSLRTMGLEVPFAIVAVDMVTTHASMVRTRCRPLLRADTGGGKHVRNAATLTQIASA